jgi:hypothetical protein
MNAAMTLTHAVPLDIEELDRSLEAALLLRASEAGFARDYRSGAAFGQEEDRLRLEAFSLGLLDALAQRLGDRQQNLRLLAYMNALVEYGPGIKAREAGQRMLDLSYKPQLGRYVAGGRRHALKVLRGNARETGLFAELLVEELQS